MPLPFGENVFGIKTLAPSQSTNTVILSVDLQPPSFLTSTTYSVVSFGFTVIDGELEEMIPGAFNQCTQLTSDELVGVIVIGCAPFFIVISVPASTVGMG